MVSIINSAQQVNYFLNYRYSLTLKRFLENWGKKKKQTKPNNIKESAKSSAGSFKEFSNRSFSLILDRKDHKMHLSLVITCRESHRHLICATPYLVFKTWHNTGLGKYLFIAAVLLFLCRYYQDLQSQVKKCLMTSKFMWAFLCMALPLYEKKESCVCLHKMK